MDGVAGLARSVRAFVRAYRHALLVLVLMVVLLVGYAVWSVLSVRSELLAAQRHARQVQAGIAAGNAPAARAALASFVTSTSAAASRSDGLLWKVGGHLPFLGEDVRAVRIVADAGASIGRVAQERAFPADKPDLISTLAPKNGHVDLAAVGRARTAVVALDAAVQDAARPVGTVRLGHLSGFLRPSFTTFLDKLDRARGSISAAAKAVQVLPTMLGQDRTQHYLLRFDNNAEIRSRGGVPGAWSLLAARAGTVSLARQGSSADFAAFPSPVLPMTSAESRIYQSLPGIYWQDTGFSPDFPRSAQLASVMWTRTFPGTTLDGVIDVDAVAMAHLLGVIGPVRTKDGTEIDAGNAVEELLSKVYQRYPRPADQDAFFAQVAATVFHRVTTFSGSPLTLLSALAWGVNHGRVHVYSAHDEVQRTLAGTTVAGELSLRATRSPSLVIGLNDLTQSKMSYYLRYGISTRATRCSGGRQVLASTATFSEDEAAGGSLPLYVTGPAHRVPTGQQLVTARVYSPVGADFGQFVVNGEPVWVNIQDDHERQVAEIAVQLEPGESKSISWTLTTAPGQTGDTVQEQTPGISASSPFRSRIVSAC